MPSEVEATGLRSKCRRCCFGTDNISLACGDRACKSDSVDVAGVHRSQRRERRRRLAESLGIVQHAGEGHVCRERSALRDACVALPLDCTIENRRARGGVFMGLQLPGGDEQHLAGCREGIGPAADSLVNRETCGIDVAKGRESASLVKQGGYGFWMLPSASLCRRAFTAMIAEKMICLGKTLPIGRP